MNSKAKGKRGEAWKPIRGYEGLYEVSDLGRVKSTRRSGTNGRIMKIQVNSRNGYSYVCLCKDNKKKTCRVHVLVLEAFTDYVSRSGLVIDHIDCDKNNNRLDNLEAVTQKENDRRSRDNKLQTFAGTEVIDLDTKETYPTYTAAAIAVGGHAGEMVARVCRGERSHYRNRHFAKLEDYNNGTIPKFVGKNIRKASETLWR